MTHGRRENRTLTGVLLLCCCAFLANISAWHYSSILEDIYLRTTTPIHKEQVTSKCAGRVKRSSNEDIQVLRLDESLQSNHSPWQPTLHGNQFSLTTSSRNMSTCTDPVTKFAFIKVHKTGGTSVLGIFHRLAVLHSLNTVLPRMNPNVGHPFQIREEDYPALKSGKFDILAEHSVYNRDVIDSIIGEGAMYLAILRQPVAQLASSFNFYKLSNTFPKEARRNPIEWFLQDPWVRQTFAKDKHQHVANKAFSKLRNYQAYDLGFPLGLFNSAEATRDFVAKIDREFDLVLILEHFDESLVLLRRLMCWNVKDILYVKRNDKGKYAFKRSRTPLSEEALKNHREFSKADYDLYDHFNRTLWQKISREGHDFYEELKQFNLINAEVTAFCDKNTFRAERRFFPATKWYDGFDVDRKFCFLLSLPIMKLRKLVFGVMLYQGKFKYEWAIGKPKISPKNWENNMEKFLKMAPDFLKHKGMNDFIGSDLLGRL